MVMAEKPVGEFTPLADHFKKVRQFIRSIGWIDPVSYTHLDVYKRQGLQMGVPHIFKID